MRTGVLLINVGTPDSPKVSDVRRYLTEFLNDPYVIDLPFLARKVLVNLIIIPLRVRDSAKLYSELWTEEGSPLLVNSRKLSLGVQAVLGEEYLVVVAMRYQKPSISDAIAEFQGKVDRLIVVPMYPQYAESTTRTSIERTESIL